jgi:stage V sporulation protein D (sporulation-specific penicillin-binding protein)
MRLGKESFFNYITAFGFGQKTDIKLPGEAKGLVYSYDKIGPVELATISFGQGIAVTPIQLITAVSAVANNGLLLEPRLVKEVRNLDGEIIEEFKKVPVRQIVSEETAKRTLKLLENVVSDGTGESAQIEGFKIGGKTGTAKHYGEQIYDSSFIGIVPVDNPQFVILVVLYDISGYPYYGSQTAAPIFRNVALDTLRYLDIPPEILPLDKKDKNEQYINIPDICNLSIEEAEYILRKTGLNVKLEGRANIVLKQIPLAGSRVRKNSTVIIFTESQEYEKKFYVAVPDLIGFNSENAADLLAELGLKLIYNGKGKVIKQDIEPGTRIPGGSKVRVELEE